MHRILLVITLLWPSIALATVDGETCRSFYKLLEAVPHESIFQREGMFNSQWFETAAQGCFLVMNTSEDRLDGMAMPDLSGAPGTPLYVEGWRVNPKYIADGAGTGVVGMERGEELCLVYTEQPTYLNDDGKIARGVFIKVRVECTEGSLGKGPKLILREAK